MSRPFLSLMETDQVESPFPLLLVSAMFSFSAQKNRPTPGVAYPFFSTRRVQSA
jgi:hypothetical protein